jgi:polyphosphate kinase
MDMPSTSEPPETVDELTVQPARYFNRELSWLAFNERVLAEASNPNYPLLERLRFLSISGNNIDEFLMVRVAGFHAQVRSQIEEISIDGLTPSQAIAITHEKVLELEQIQQQTWTTLKAQLAEAGIVVVGEDDEISPERDTWLREYFTEHVMPVITPQAIDPAHPFPFVANQGIGVLFSLSRIADNAPVMEMVLIPSPLPRFVRIPGEEAA